MIDLPPPIAVHAPVPVVKTANATGFNTNRTETSQRQNTMGGGSFTPIVSFYSSPMFMGGKNNHRKKRSNMNHVSKMTRGKHRKNRG